MEFRVVRETRRRVPAVPWLRLFTAVQRRQHAASSTSIALVLATPKRMAFLNRAYHGGQGPTDVLAFPAAVPPDTRGSGDVVLCPEVIGRGVPARTFAQLLAHRFVHALLHLHGYQHGTPRQAAAMEAAVQRVLTTVLPHGRNHPA